MLRQLPSLIGLTSFFFLGCGARDTPTPGGDGDGGGQSVDTVGTQCKIGESSATFGGYSSGTETSPGFPECGESICLANHTVGRIDCPYGQTEEDLALPSDDPNRCSTPSGEPVTVPVQAQFVDRRADDNVYCTCRCNGPEEFAPFCECPDGFVCEPLIEALGLNKESAGSYCIKEGTAYDPNFPPSERCHRALSNCE